MSGFSLGTKSTQSQTFSEDGKRVPSTFIKTNPCYVVSISWPESQRYFAVTLGFGLTKNIKKSVKGQLDKAGIKTPLHFLREFRLDKAKNQFTPLEEEGKKGLSHGEVKLFIGDELKPATLFKKGDSVAVSGTSKGKGFQGVVKRHGFAGGPKTHGQSNRERHPGSIGSTTTPGRVFRGKRMAGRMGQDRVTVKNLEVLEVKDDGLLIRGLVPGARNGLLEVRSSL